MIRKWKLISRKDILDHPRMKLVEDTVELPNGKEVSYLRESPNGYDSVAVIAINEQKEILIQREYSYPPDKVMYQLPGGGLENTEDVITAANRELSEESGYIAEGSQIIGSFYVNNRRSDTRQHVVICGNLSQQKLKHDDEEFIESEWKSIDDIKLLIRNGEIDNVNFLAALTLFTNR